MKAADMDTEYAIKQYAFPLDESFSIDKSINDFETPALDSRHAESWPVLYILTNDKAKTAYIGETTNFKRRMNQHRADAEKDFNKTLLIDNSSFNQSVTFDYENRLIELFSADHHFKITNRNNGMARVDYFERSQYRQQFRVLWDKLRENHYTVHSLEDLENTDLFKYSPYKSLTPDQYQSIETILKTIKTKGKSITVVSGMPGTGKTILAVATLFKLKNELREKEEYRDLKVGFVCPMESLKKTLQKLSRSLPGLKASDFISPSEAVNKSHYDVLLVDEAHRLGNRLGAGAGINAFDKACAQLNLPQTVNKVDWLAQCTDKLFLFYDPHQQIRATGLSQGILERFLNRQAESGIVVDEFSLSTQMRVRGGDEYLDYVYDLLSNKMFLHAGMNFDRLFSPGPYDARQKDPNSDTPRYQFALVEKFEDFCKLQKVKETESGLSRMVAGFAWKWKSKNNKNAIDIEIDGIQKRWNSKRNDWVNSENAVNEVGCIHTVQGYDLNYGFVIIGNDLRYDSEHDRIIIDKSNFKDVGAKKTADKEELTQVIVNAYYVLMTRGMLGTFLYVCDPELRNYIARYVPTI